MLRRGWKVRRRTGLSMRVQARQSSRQVVAMLRRGPVATRTRHLIGAGLCLWVLQAPAAQSPQQLLARMNLALEETQFTGTLVYLHGQHLAALRITHRTQEGNAGESLLSLTGPVRALSRHARGVTCMLPDVAPLSVRSADGHQPSMLRRLPLDFDRLLAHYRIEALGRYRVAGRDTEVVGLLASDSFRYGYRFYLDADAGLPLKVDLLDEDGVAIQQVMFTDIAIEGRVSAASGVARPPSTGVAPLLGRSSAEAPWLSGRIPPGFRVVADEARLRQDGAEMRQLVLSDGLASFSVYLEPPTADAMQGQSRLGAVTAVGGRIGALQVTVVGEVPLATARRILGHPAGTTEP